VVTYGLTPQAELIAAEIETSPAGSRFGVRLRGQDLGRVELPLPGTHNVQNALAAIAVGLALRLDFGAMARALASFRGVHRRFERLGSWRGAAVVDDYAHHPTEVAATLQAARQAFPRAAIHAVFQPHLFSRTRDHAADFGRALLAAEHALVTEVYASRESPIDGVTGELVASAARASGHRNVGFCADRAELRRELERDVKEGDLILTLGAGDIYRFAEQLAAEGVL